MAAKDEAEMDRLAELIAEGKSFGVAARRMKISRFRADFLWARIVARIGRQAEESE